ncbi:MAG: hypothetical protein GY867_09855, partial [bacterium]|nr:hypothetical protein [bacterium]
WFADEDILAYNTNTGVWSKYFDGSDVGFSWTDLDAFTLLDDGSLLISLDRPKSLPGLGWVDDSDIVRFTPTSLGENTAGSFEWYFDGSDVGLFWSNEDVDSISVTSDGRLLLSTTGSFAVPGIGGRDEDLIIFTPTSLGENTSGSWDRYFDGSDVALRRNSEDVRGGQIDEAGGDIYLTTKGNFSVPGLSGDGSDIFICTPGSLGANTSCTFSLYWAGSAHGLAGEKVDAFATGGQVAVSMTGADKAGLNEAEVEVDDMPGEENIPADDAGEENDTDDIHDLDDISPGDENDNPAIYLPLITDGASPGNSGPASLPDVVIDSVLL